MKNTNDGDSRVRWLLLVLMILLVGGCGVTGTWKRVTTDPPNAPFPVDDLRLDRNGDYSARWKYKGRVLTSHGTYEYRRGELIVAQSGSMPRTYGASLRFDGKLELTYTASGDSIKAVLERQLLPIPKQEPAAQEEPVEIPPDGNDPTPISPTDAADVPSDS